MKFEVLSLFSIPLLITNLEVSQDIIDYVHELDYQRTNFDNADISLHRNILEDFIFQKYSTQIDLIVNEFAYEIIGIDKTKITFERTASWVNRHHHSDWAQTHMHNNSTLSGVWYLETTDGCGNLNLHSPSNIFGSPLDYPISNYNFFNSETCKISPFVGNLCLFPSTLKHSVDKNMTQKIRSSIAFNYYARGIVYSEGNSITL